MSIAEFFIGPSSEGLAISVDLKLLDNKYVVFYCNPDEGYNRYEFSDLKITINGYIDGSFDDKEEANEYILKKYKPVHIVRYDEEFKNLVL
ncbi:hypothetical protein ACOMCU_16160 [Lysinibacillus sp. UGB7]|uniref:hypothetical protein n=1 Tax=Lysinibacillus sp. UGB7 TaxID=3411039 RepID=UPI003B76E70C